MLKTVVEAQDILIKLGSFKDNRWKEKANISRFVQANYIYDGDGFLAGPTERSLHIKKIVKKQRSTQETRFPMDTRPTSIADIPAGFIDKKMRLSSVSKTMNSSN